MEGGVLHEVKIISCNKTRYKPTLVKRAVDIRADKLQQEYIEKARVERQTECTTTRPPAPPVP